MTGLLRRLFAKPAPLPTLDRPLVVVDVGCRWGFADQWDSLGDSVRLYGFDPDAAECARLAPKYAGRPVTLVPLALADSPGKRTLYLTSEPACSSLYPPDQSLIHLPGMVCHRQVGTTEVECTTLDLWAETAGVKAIDFLKLDTQGSELDILFGSERMLKSVRALEIEVEFNPMYTGQPLFGDVDAFMRTRGFVLWRLGNMTHYGPEIEPARIADDTTFYTATKVRTTVHGGQLYWGHAYYVRSEIAAGKVSGGQRERDAALFRTLGFFDLPPPSTTTLESVRENFRTEYLRHS